MIGLESLDRHDGMGGSKRGSTLPSKAYRTDVLRPPTRPPPCPPKVMYSSTHETSAPKSGWCVEPPTKPPTKRNLDRPENGSDGGGVRGCTSYIPPPPTQAVAAVASPHQAEPLAMRHAAATRHSRREHLVYWSPKQGAAARGMHASFRRSILHILRIE